MLTQLFCLLQRTNQEFLEANAVAFANKYIKMSQFSKAVFSGQTFSRVMKPYFSGKPNFTRLLESH